MVNQQLEEWIKQQKKSGFSEGEIRKTLANSGYMPSDINEAFCVSPKFGAKITESGTNFMSGKGVPFQILFYVGIFLLANPLGIWCEFFFSLNLVQKMGNFLVYFLMILFGLAFGSGFGYFLKKLGSDFKTHVITGVIFSGSLAWYFALNKVILKMTESIAAATEFSVALPILAFILILLAINIPLIAFCKDKFNWKWLLLYLLVALSFLIAYILYEAIVKAVFAQVASSIPFLG